MKYHEWIKKMSHDGLYERQFTYEDFPGAPPKGSTEPRVLKEGAKYDQGKARMELLPPELMFAVADILTFGAKKYEDRNWEKGMKWSRVYGALQRHLWAWWAGKGPTTKSFLFGDLDSETGKSHLWHAGCCIAFLIAYEEREMTEFDDRYKPNG